MAGAQANVRNVITIEGVDSASDAIKRAQASMKGLEGQAKKTGDATDKIDPAKGIDPSKIQSTTQRAGGAFAALAAALGPTGQAIADVGRSATALGSTANILPGPIGLAAAAVVGLGAGIYLLGKYTSETAAKLALLGNADTARLKDNLNLSVDGAIKLTQALDDLKDRTLKPTDNLLAQVAKNAESMGKDGGEAAAAFVAALEQGPEALKKFQQEYGKLNGLVADQTALAARLGLQANLLGLVKAQTEEEARQAEITKTLTRLQERKAELAKVEDDLAHQQGMAKEAAQVADRINADIAAKALAVKAEAVRKQIQLDKDDLEVVQKETQARQDQADAMNVLVARGDVLEAQAGATHNKKHRAQLTEEANTVRILAALRTLNQFDLAHGKTLDAKLTIERATLQVKLLQANAAEIQAKEARKQEIQQAAQEASAKRQALFDASLKMTRAQADRDGLQTEHERIALLTLEHDKDLDATKAIKGAKVRALARLAVDEDYKTKRAQLDQQVADETNKTNDDVLKTLEDSNKKSADLAQAANEAIVGTTRARSASVADALRTQGKEEEAQLVELRQAQADYAQAVITIDKDRIDALKTVVADSTDAANIEIQSDQKKLQAKLALEDVERKIGEAQKQRAQDARASAADSLEGPAKTLQALAQLGPAFSRAGALGDGLSAGVKGFKDLDKAMSATEHKTAKVTAAIGDTFAGVADAVIDSETKRTIAQLDNEERRKLSTATTEEQRAAITQQYEDKKAKAVEAAERQKAGIQALVETAKAIASAAEYDYVGAVGHGAAAVAYGAIAGGAIGGASAVGGSNTYTGGFNAPGSSGDSGSAGNGSGKGVTYVYNFNQLMTTKQEVGKAIQGNLRSLQGTGTDRSKGV